MKLMNFKIVTVILAGFALLVLSGCDGTTGIASNEALVDGEVSVSEAQCLLDAGGYEAIEVGGRTWLDRNLGASEVASSRTDTAAYGNLYQYGRAADGHEDRNSGTTTTQATTLTPDHPDFIIINSGYLDWTSADTDGSLRSLSWSTPYDDTNNLNQVCPCGYVLPKFSDFMDLNTTEVEALKLSYGGIRVFSSANILYEGTKGYYWTNVTGQGVSIDQYTMNIFGSPRANAVSVRCIKPLP